MENIRKLLDKVLLKLLNLEAVEIEQTSDSEKIGVFKRDFGMAYFDWPQGVGLYGIYLMYKYFDDSKYKNYLIKWFEDRIKEGLPSKNINTTIPVLTLLLINQEEHRKDFQKIIDDYKDYLLFELPRTDEGGFEHVTSSTKTGEHIMRHEQQLWVDTVFMSVLFLALYGSAFNDKMCQEESIKQMDIHIKYLFNPETNLMYHGYSFIEKNHFADAYWARGNGWFCLGIPLFIMFSKNLEDNIKQKYLNILKRQLSSIKNYAEDGMLHTLIDKKDSYLETSGTCLFLTGMLLAYNQNYIESIDEEFVEQSINSLIKQISLDGVVENVSCGTGIGKDLTKYYNIIKKPMAYGQSLMLLTLLEYLKYKDN